MDAMRHISCASACVRDGKVKRDEEYVRMVNRNLVDEAIVTS